MDGSIENIKRHQLIELQNSRLFEKPNCLIVEYILLSVF